MGAKETAEALEKMISRTAQAEALKFADTLSFIEKGIVKVRSAASGVMAPISSMSSAISSSNDAFDSFQNLVNLSGASLAVIADKMGMSGLSGQFLALTKAITGANKELYNLGAQLDSDTEGIRKYRSDMFELAATFGKSYEESQEFAKGLAGLSGEISSRSVVSFDELQNAASKATSSFSRAGLSLDKLMGTIDAGGKSFGFLEAAILMARRSGEDIGTTMNSITTAVQRQGVSIETAMAQYSSFLNTAEETGLTFTEVRNSLEQTAQGFAMMGANADFARPIIETFARSLSATGLGISNATSLSENLSRQLLGVADSYEKAYLMFEKGGLDVGGSGGGVLGASIGLRARIMRAEKAGEQSEIGLEMANAMKKTLESFTGGRLIDIEEADANRSLSATYMKQESILSSMFGLDKSNAARTIEMLKKLDDTTVMSNKELKDELGNNINDQLKNQDKNLSYQDKISKNTQNMFASSVLTNEILMKMVDRSSQATTKLAEGQTTVMGAGIKMGVGGAEMIGGALESGMSTLDAKLNQLQGYVQNMEAASSGISGKGGAANVSQAAYMDSGASIFNQQTADGKALQRHMSNIESYLQTIAANSQNPGSGASASGNPGSNQYGGGLNLSKVKVP